MYIVNSSSARFSNAVVRVLTECFRDITQHQRNLQLLIQVQPCHGETLENFLHFAHVLHHVLAFAAPFYNQTPKIWYLGCSVGFSKWPISLVHASRSVFVLFPFKRSIVARARSLESEALTTAAFLGAFSVTATYSGLDLVTYFRRSSGIISCCYLIHSTSELELFPFRLRVEKKTLVDWLLRQLMPKRWAHNLLESWNERTIDLVDGLTWTDHLF